jgi:pyruvate dehydrogenase E2 component (dihydrolipoamide acetyltransferase)
VAEDGGKLTLTVLVLKAVAAALRAMPRFNASLDAEGETIILKHYCHIGVAVAAEQGLLGLVPVVRDVDRKSVRELAVELTEQAQRAPVSWNARRWTKARSRRRSSPVTRRPTTPAPCRQ